VRETVPFLGRQWSGYVGRDALMGEIKE
jgi:hypothetical protein